MQVAPPPSSGPRIQELGDTLVVTFRPRRSWGDLFFLGVWLTLWTFGGIAALSALAGVGWGGRVFLVFWLCGWALGEALAASQIGWQLAGREVLTLTPNQLEVRRHVGRFARTQRLHALSIYDVAAEQVPTEDDEAPRTDYRLRISSRDKTLFVGEGMDERRAGDLVTLIGSRVHPRRVWNADPDEYGFALIADLAPRILDSATGPIGRPAHGFRWGFVLVRVGPALVGAIAIAFVAYAVLPPLRQRPQPTRLVPPLAPAVEPPPASADALRRSNGPPVRQAFGKPRLYAIAMTRYALRGSRTKLESAPRCGKTVTWTHWTCRARGRARIGPFAGRSLVYRCTPEHEREPLAPPAQVILCGPEHPPPITS